MTRPKKIKYPSGVNGSMPLPMPWGRHYRVYGGRSYQRPKNMRFVKMAAEINVPCDVSIPTHDFCTPEQHHLDYGLIGAVKLILSGTPVFVGCMGGIGRTGLLLAILAKAWGVEDPVAYVREHYIPHAVETHEQKEFVASYAIPKEVSDLIWKAKLRTRLKFWQRGEQTELAFDPHMA